MLACSGEKCGEVAIKVIAFCDCWVRTTAGRKVRIYGLYCVQKIAMCCEGILRFQQFPQHWGQQPLQSARSFQKPLTGPRVQPTTCPLIRRPAWTWALPCAFSHELSPFRHSPYVLIFQTRRIPKYWSRTWVTIGERGRFVQWKHDLLFEFVDDMAWSTPNNALCTADFTCWCATNPESSILFGKATLLQMVNTPFLFSTSFRKHMAARCGKKSMRSKLGVFHHKWFVEREVRRSNLSPVLATQCTNERGIKYSQLSHQEKTEWGALSVSVVRLRHKQLLRIWKACKVIPVVMRNRHTLQKFRGEKILCTKQASG